MSQKSQGGSGDGLFVSGKTLEKGSTSGGGNKGKERSKSRGLTKIRLATIASLKATSRRIDGNGKRKMLMMMGLGTQLAMPMVVT